MLECCYCFLHASLLCSACYHPAHMYCSHECQKATQPVYTQLCQHARDTMKKPAFIGGPVQDEIDEIWAKIIQLKETRPKTSDEANQIADQLLVLAKRLADLHRRLPEPPPSAIPLDIVSEVFRYTRPYTYKDLYQSMVAMRQLPSKLRMRSVIKTLVGQDATLVAKILKDAMDKDDVMLYELLRDAEVAGYDQAVDAFINTAYPAMTLDRIFPKAAWMGKVAVMQLTLDKGAHKDIRDKNGMTPLMWAAVWNHGAVAQRLLDAGASKDIRSDNGSTALIQAAEGGNDAVVQRLLKAGADKDMQTKGGWTALMWAAQNGHDAVVKRLIDAGADKDIKNSDGWTALMWAALEGRDAVVQRLLDAGASKDIKSDDGQTALMLAKTDAVRRLLRT